MFEIEFYETETGRIPVAEFLNTLPTKHQAKALWEIELLSSLGTSIREPYAKHITGELWELRIKFSSDISRVFYFIPGKRIVLLHGFVKKTQKTPPVEIETAQKRLEDYKRRCLW